jgi:hypothetical protein
MSDADKLSEADKMCHEMGVPPAEAYARYRLNDGEAQQSRARAYAAQRAAHSKDRVGGIPPPAAPPMSDIPWPVGPASQPTGGAPPSQRREEAWPEHPSS